MMSHNESQITLVLLLLIAGVVLSSEPSTTPIYETMDPKALQQATSLMQIRNYLSYAVNMDIVFLVDVSYNTTQYLTPLAALGKLAVSCLTGMREGNNKIALITFGNTSRLEYGFRECFEEGCLKNVSDTVMERSEIRKIGKGLRYAKRLLKKEQRDYKKQSDQNYPRKQCIVLVTFGVDVSENEFPMVPRILSNGIDMVVIGVGKNAAKDEATLNSITKPYTKQSKRSGMILVTEHSEYLFTLLENAVKYTCF